MTPFPAVVQKRLLCRSDSVFGTAHGFPISRLADSRTRWSRESFIEHNSSHDQTEDDGCGQEQPTPILGWMAESADEMASIVIGDDCNEGVTCAPANDHYGQKSPDTVVGSTCGREEHACGHRNRYRRGDGKSTGAPFMKEVENGIQLPMPELTVQVCRSSPSCESKREVCADHRSCRCNCRILIRRIAVAGRKNCRQDVRASKCRQRRAIQNGEEEEPKCSQVAEHRGRAVRCGIWDEDVQHERNISTFAGRLWEQPLILSQLFPAIPDTIANEESAFNQAAGGLLPPNTRKGEQTQQDRTD